MKNLWNLISLRWSREEIARWSSFRKTAYLLLPLLLYFAAHDTAQVLLWALANQLVVSGGNGLAGILTDNAYTTGGVINGLSILLGVAAIWRAVRGEVRTGKVKGAGVGSMEDLCGDGGGSGSSAELFTRYAFLAGLAFCTAISLNLLFNLLGLTAGSKSFSQTARQQFGVDFGVGLLLYAVVSPVAEEAVFRGLIFNRMKRCFGYIIALFVSSLLFGCYHGNPVQALYGTIIGLLIAYTYEKCGSFAAPVLFHAVANVCIYVFTYLDGFSKMSRPASIGAIIFGLVGAGICLRCVVGKDGQH